MKIAMIGSGAAGSVFAAYLKKGGADMYLVDRYKAHMDAIAENGLVFRQGDEEICLKGFSTCAEATELEKMDAVILMVKCTQTADVMPQVMHCVGEDTVVVSLQNGLDNHESIGAFVEDERIILGFGKIGTELSAPGVCVARPEPGTAMYFGAVKESARSREVGQELEKLFNAGGCQAEFVSDIRPYIWRKAISNCGYNTVGAVLGLTVGAVLRSEEGSRLVSQVWKECCDVAKALGVGDFWGEMAEERERLLEGFADYYPSMAQDVIRRRQTEIDHMNGAVCRFGREMGVETPVNALLTDMIRVIEQNYELKK